MFTVRFIRPDGVYRSFSVISYEVKRDLQGDAAISISRKLNCQDAIVKNVGKKHEYDVAFITNGAGRTIDVIRSKQRRS